MQKCKKYINTKFLVSTLDEVSKIIISKYKTGIAPQITGTIYYLDHEWTYDTINEFLTEYQKARFFIFGIYLDKPRLHLLLQSYSYGQISVSMTANNRQDIEDVYSVFERDLDKSTIDVETKVDPVKIFIGHGRNTQWRDLKDHLHEKHGYDVEAYEIGPRAGLSIKDVLEKMLNESSFALLVLTGEDEKNDGEIHARQNVVHELGLFQGRLGFNRAIALLEDGTTEFSNILGVNQLRFSKGKIKEVFGDVVATINREFPDN